jgi:DNA adenine methylase
MLFPYFGAKSKAAELVWEHLGDPECYVEPFGGTLAVLLTRLTPPKVEIAVDLDGLLVNFWRTIQQDWRTMEPFLSLAVSEIDVRAKHAALINARSSLTEKLMDPKYYDPELAAWWWEGISSWLGSGYGHRMSRQRPHIDRSLKGAWAKGMTDDKLQMVANRLGNVIILSGDWQDAWKRSVTAAIINRFNRGVGVFLDPPYVDNERAKGLYAEDTPLNEKIIEWCLDQPRHVKIVVAGYNDEYDALREAGWLVIPWKAPNGYAQESNKRRHNEALYVRRRVIRRGASALPK